MIVKSVMKRKDDREPEDPDIFFAAQYGDLDMLMQCLNLGQSLDSRDKNNGQTPLHRAAIYGQENFIVYVASNLQFDPWIRDYMNKVAFDHSCARSDRGAMKALYRCMYGVDLDQQNSMDPKV